MTGEKTSSERQEVHSYNGSCIDLTSAQTFPHLTDDLEIVGVKEEGAKHVEGMPGKSKSVDAEDIACTGEFSPTPEELEKRKLLRKNERLQKRVEAMQKQLLQKEVEDSEVQVAEKLEGQAVSKVEAVVSAPSYPIFWTPGLDKIALVDLPLPRDHPNYKPVKPCGPPVLMDLTADAAPSTSANPADNVANEVQMVLEHFLAGGLHVEQVVRIQRIQNERLWFKYQIRRAEVAEAAGEAKVNEQLLFHGADDTTMKKIYTEGFDIRVANMGGALGVGSYFAQASSYSDTYSKMSLHAAGCHGRRPAIGNVFRGEQAVARGHHVMTLCPTVLGRLGKGQHGMRRPPEGKDSVCSGIALQRSRSGSTAKGNKNKAAWQTWCQELLP
ncbi:hypothetical protein CYMTET_12473 [Cymbomonas tetramitiformis]|uniref:Poly [ADP-ribose] polymerase n=1 Tax=Cymbomonas tetramitiformis TaxID=36881 RepID=A0AAE0GK92_9CHLO|nr:hypothetical protein CYMTET_12473 [Cymbomonas tetramitiformis]